MARAEPPPVPRAARLPSVTTAAVAALAPSPAHACERGRAVAARRTRRRGKPPSWLAPFWLPLPGQRSEAIRGVAPAYWQLDIELTTWRIVKTSRSTRTYSAANTTTTAMLVAAIAWRRGARAVGRPRDSG